VQVTEIIDLKKIQNNLEQKINNLNFKIKDFEEREKVYQDTEEFYARNFFEHRWKNFPRSTGYRKTKKPHVE
jgi:uncharacterized protein YlxW (UPF0749 family)